MCPKPSSSPTRLVLALLLLTGCRGCSRPQAPRICSSPVPVSIEATAQVNPDTAGAALPTVVRLYQLRSPTRLEQAEFTDIWQRPKETLADDLVQEVEVTAFPESARQMSLTIQPGAQFLAGVAIVRLPTGTQWRTIVPLPRSGKPCAGPEQAGSPLPAISFHVDRYRIEARSQFANAGALDLPRDVAPERTRAEKSR